MYCDANSNIYLEGNQLRSEKLLKMLKIQPCQKKQEHFLGARTLYGTGSACAKTVKYKKTIPCLEKKTNVACLQMAQEDTG